MGYKGRELDLKQIEITDEFWKGKMELVRKEVIPYQWEILNDRVEGAAPSYAMHNFRAAKRLNALLKEHPEKAPKFEYKGFEELPDGEVLPLNHYGFVFQDTDFYKWVEAVAYSLVDHPDEALEKLADEAIHLVEEAQSEDGYLDTYYILNGKDAIFSNLRDNHELYCFGHLTEAAVAYFEATGKDVLLKVAEKFATYIDEHIGKEEGKKHGYPGHEIAEMALVRLYKVTGEKKYLGLAKYFIDERGQAPIYFDVEHPEEIHDYQSKEDPYSYFQAHLPVRMQDEAMGHSVRATYLYSGMASVAKETEDEELSKACDALFRSISREKMYITGGIGSTKVGEAFSYPFDLPNGLAYAESCASIGLIFFARRMLEMKADSKYSDVMERALYNTVLSGIALDGKSFFYVNPLEAKPIASKRDFRKEHVKIVRQKWFGCACCPPNIARLLSSIGSYAFTEDEDTLYNHLFMSANVKKKVGDQCVTVKTTVDYPEATLMRVTYHVEHAEGTGFKLAIRLPWYMDMKNGSSIEGVDESEMEIRQGYAYILNPKSDSDIELKIKMVPRFYEADPRVSENAGKVAVMVGPTVYAMESVDNGADIHNIHLIPDPAKVEYEEIEIEGNKATALIVPGVRISSGNDTDDSLYFEVGSLKEEDVKVKMIPYYMWANRGENEMQVWSLKK